MSGVGSEIAGTEMMLTELKQDIEDQVTNKIIDSASPESPFDQIVKYLNSETKFDKASPGMKKQMIEIQQMELNTPGGPSSN